jgi:hypothetical protein
MVAAFCSFCRFLYGNHCNFCEVLGPLSSFIYGVQTDMTKLIVAFRNIAHSHKERQ